MEVWEKDGHKGLNVFCRFGFFFFLVAALRMLLYLIFRVLLPWLPESFLSSTPIVAGRQ